MKYFVIFLILIGFAGLFPLVNQAYGLWIPESPDTLLEQSQTVFVGTITSVNVIEFEKSSILSIDEDGVEKQIIENYTLSLDQYTVSIEEFLKNPQNSSTMIVLQPTTSIPDRIIPIGGFVIGDRVLLYLKKIDEENIYSPESFEIPKQCDAKSAFYKPRITLVNSFRITQDGIQRDDNFTAGIPMQFVYDIDTRTLDGKGYDFVVGIVKRLTDNSVESVLKEKIHTKSNPCEWITSAKWEITPTAGKHIMAIQISEEDGGSSHSIQFFVNENISTENKPPLKLDDLASELWYEHDYIIDGTILDIRGYDKPERTYDIQINSFFKPTESTGIKLITVYGFPNFDNVKGDRGIFFIKKEDSKWQFGQYGAKATKECTPELMYHTPLLVEPLFYHSAPASDRDFTYAVDCYPYYYKKYLPQYMKAHGAVVFPSPLSQAIDQVPANEIVCNEGLELVLKHNGNPACVKPETKTKLIERGWGTMTYLDKTIEVQGTDHSVKYRTDGNATVTDSTYSEATAEVIITLDAITSGSLTIELPRTLIDSGHSNCDPYYERDEPFAVLIDHEEVLFEEIATTSEKRTLSISFQENAKKIEIVSFCLI